jgi:hypothetical protein
MVRFVFARLRKAHPKPPKVAIKARTPLTRAQRRQRVRIAAATIEKYWRRRAAIPEMRQMVRAAKARIRRAEIAGRRAKPIKPEFVSRLGTVA